MPKSIPNKYIKILELKALMYQYSLHRIMKLLNDKVIEEAAELNIPFTGLSFLNEFGLHSNIKFKSRQISVAIQKLLPLGDCFADWGVPDKWLLIFPSEMTPFNLLCCGCCYFC